MRKKERDDVNIDIDVEIPFFCLFTSQQNRDLNRDWEKPFMGDRQNKQNNIILSSINNSKCFMGDRQNKQNNSILSSLNN